MQQVFPAIVELAFTGVETDQVFGALSAGSNANLGTLRQDFKTYLQANEPTAKRDSVGTTIVNLALQNGLEVWKDCEGKSWATLRQRGHAEHHPLNKTAVRDYLTCLYHEETQSVPHAQGLQDALNTLAAKAVIGGSEYQTFVRVAEVDGVIYVDLANDNWQVVRVTTQDWSVVGSDDVPVRFRRPSGMQALPTPWTGGKVTELAELLNVSPDSREWKLIVAYLLQALRGTGPYPLLVLTGDQGSGKSTSAKMLRATLDPNTSPLRSLSRDERDLFIAAKNGWALTFDNISGLSQWISDALCKLSTGGGLSVRQLYSDADETLLDAMRPVILNGITDFVDKQDLVDRALQVRLPSIPKSERRTERELWARFADAQPRVLGALLDVTVDGLRRLPTTTLNDFPRLADFALWVTACEAPLGWPPGEFIAAYEDAQDDLVKDALETEPVAEALLTLLTLDRPEWRGTASELLAELTARKYGDKRPPKDWPGAPHVLVNRMKRLTSALLAQGLEVTQLSRSGKKGAKLWQIRTVGGGERQKRQNDPEGADNTAQDVAPAAASPTDAYSLTEIRSVSSTAQASAGLMGEAQQNVSAVASDAPAPEPSNGATDTPKWSLEQ